MKISNLLFLTAGACLIFASEVEAAQLRFSYTGNGVESTGTITTTDLNPSTGTYQLLGISGERNNNPIVGIVPLNSTAFFDYDNLLKNSSPFVDSSGFVYSIRSSNNLLNVFLDVGGVFTSTGATTVVESEYIPAINFYSNTPINLTISAATAVPEPTLHLPDILILGALGAVYFLKRKLSWKSTRRLRRTC